MVSEDTCIFQLSDLLDILSLIQPNINLPKTFEIPIEDNKYAAFEGDNKSSPSVYIKFKFYIYFLINL